MTRDRIRSRRAAAAVSQPIVQVITRRAALVPTLMLPFGAVLLGCSRGPSCTDVSALSPQDKKVRSEVAAYVESTPEVAKRCVVCIHYEPGPAGACGGCKVVKGPINPEGTCKLFASKPA